MRENKEISSCEQVIAAAQRQKELNKQASSGPVRGEQEKYVTSKYFARKAPTGQNHPQSQGQGDKKIEGGYKGGKKRVICFNC
jgi:hypothetical protein